MGDLTSDTSVHFPPSASPYVPIYFFLPTLFSLHLCTPLEGLTWTKNCWNTLRNALDPSGRCSAALAGLGSVKRLSGRCLWLWEVPAAVLVMLPLGFVLKILEEQPNTKWGFSGKRPPCIKEGN